MDSIQTVCQCVCCLPLCAGVGPVCQALCVLPGVCGLPLRAGVKIRMCSSVSVSEMEVEAGVTGGSLQKESTKRRPHEADPT